jgi:hypothetical protein
MEEEEYSLDLQYSTERKVYFYDFVLPDGAGGGFLSKDLEGKFIYLDGHLKSMLSKGHKGSKIKINTKTTYLEERLLTKPELEKFMKNISSRFPDLNFIQDF